MPKIIDKVILICQECNNELKVHPSKINAKYPRKYCSRDCAAKNRTGENNPKWKGGEVERKCQHCDASFLAKNKVVNKGGGKYCSHTCFLLMNARIRKEEAEMRLVEKKCRACGNPTFVKPHRVEKYGIYCSPECQSTDMSKRRSGENSPTYKHGQYVKGKRNQHRNNLIKKSQQIKNHSAAEWRELKMRYNHTCPSCGKSEPVIRLEKDHIVPVSAGGHSGIDNIQPLCRGCNVEKNIAEIRFEPYARP